MTDRSFVITAAGLISAAGDTPQDLFGAVRSGMVLAGSLHTALPEEAGAGTADAWPDFPVTPIRRFDPGYYLKRKGLLGLSRASLLAVTTASRLSERIAGVPPDEVGIAYGSAWGSLRTVVDFERAVAHDGPRAVDPLLFTESIASVPASQIAVFHGWSAWGTTLASGAASGLEAVRLAMARLEEDRGRVAVAGGGDELNLPLLRTLWNAGLTADVRGSLPYGADRSGPVGGEGACLLVVESDDSALRREVIPLARIASEAGAFVGIDLEVGRITRAAIAAVMREALDRAELTSDEIGLLVLPGNGSIDGDREQALAVIDVFGQAPHAPPAVAPKAVTGETWAASGPIGVVTALEAMRTGVVPGRSKVFAPDPDLAGLHLPRESYDRAVRHALVLDASAGGQIAALVLSAWSGQRR